MRFQVPNRAMRKVGHLKHEQASYDSSRIEPHQAANTNHHYRHQVHCPPVEFLRAISSALDVFRWSIRRFGILNGGTCILSDEYWWRKGRCRSGDGSDKLSNFNLFLCCRSILSSISWSTLKDFFCTFLLNSGFISATQLLRETISTNMKSHKKYNLIQRREVGL